ncbi:MAG: hypothetical protein WDW38_005856 [Sanguina aurantia]
MRSAGHLHPSGSNGAGSRPYWLCFVSVLSVCSMAGLALLFMSASESSTAAMQPTQLASRMVHDSIAAASSLKEAAKGAAVSLVRPATPAPGEPFDVSQLSPFQEAKLRQQTFCQDAAPLTMPDAHYVHSQGVDMFVYSKTDHVSSSISSGLGWETHDVEEIMWALAQPLPGSSSAAADAAAGKALALDIPRRLLATPDDDTMGTTDEARHRSLKQPSVSQQEQLLQRQKGLFVDVGANVGWFTLYVASRGYDVAAFEGMRSNINLIRSSLCRNASYLERVTLYPFGLGAKPDVCYIFSDDDNKGDGITLCGKANEAEAVKALHGTYNLRGVMAVRKLDDVLDRDVKVMKMDVEVSV